MSRTWRVAAGPDPPGAARSPEHAPSSASDRNKIEGRATGVRNYPMRVIHITNGDSTRLGLERSGVPGEFHSWHDVLHSGPTPAGLARDEWRRTRAAHLASGDPAGVEWILKDYERGDAALARWREFDEMVFWFEHDLYDQLILIHHLDWLSRIDDR